MTRLVALVVVSTLAAGVLRDAPHDLVISRARLLDGTGAPARTTDLAIKAGRISAIGDLSSAAALRRIDAGGRFVAPGFIDVHSHAAQGLVRPGLAQGRPLLAQGITTIVGNPDGGGPTDLEAQAKRLMEHGIGPNVALLIGHGSVRAAVMGNENRAPTAEELAEMEAIVDRAMRFGAFGLSSGLFYTPGSYATTEEVIALARRVAPFGGIYTSHIRDEGSYGIGLLAAIEEVIRVARDANVTGIVSHMKALGPDTWGKAVDAVRLLEEARASGVRVFADQYAYEASSTSLAAAVLPSWALEGGGEEVRGRLRDDSLRPRLLEGVRENIQRRGGADAIQVAHYDPDRTLEGRTLGAIAAARGRDAAETAIDLLREGSVSIVSFNMSEPDIVHIMRQPWTMTSSDGGLVAMGEGVPHPRNYGAFPRKLARYVRERGVLTIEQAVRSMTGLPAEVFGLEGRGVLREGHAADLVMFDLDRVRDTASYTNPHQLAEGMAWVFVNGAAVIEDGAFTDARPGRVLRKGKP